MARASPSRREISPPVFAVGLARSRARQVTPQTERPRLEARPPRHALERVRRDPSQRRAGRGQRSEFGRAGRAHREVDAPRRRSMASSVVVEGEHKAREARVYEALQEIAAQRGPSERRDCAMPCARRMWTSITPSTSSELRRVWLGRREDVGEAVRDAPLRGAPRR